MQAGLIDNDSQQNLAWGKNESLLNMLIQVEHISNKRNSLLTTGMFTFYLETYCKYAISGHLFFLRKNIFKSVD